VGELGWLVDFCVLKQRLKTLSIVVTQDFTINMMTSMKQLSNLKILKLKTILFPVKTMDFVPSGIEKFKFDFQIDSPPLIEETRKALR